jgi:hypothetical protein
MSATTVSDSPTPYRLDEDDIKPSGLTGQHHFTSVAGHTAQCFAAGRWANKGVRISAKVDHPGLVAEDAAAGNLASGVDRQYGNAMSLAGQHQAK